MFNLKKFSIMAIGATILLGTTVFAETGTVTTDGLRMRKEASTDSEIITSLNTNATVEIIEKTGDWYKVKYYDEYEGYLFAKYVKTKEEPSAIQEKPTETNEPTEKPTEEKTNESEQENVIKENIKYPIDTTTKNNAKVYKLPLITSTNVSEVVKDTKLKAEKELNDWVYVSSETINGWVRKSTLNITSNEEINSEEPKKEEDKTESPQQTEKPEEQKPETNNEKAASISKGYVKVEAARIRKEASTNSDILEVLTLNTSVKVLAETDDWYKIQFNDITGYISKSLISENPVQTNRSTASRQQTVQEETTKAEENKQAEEAKTEVKSEENKTGETVEKTVNETENKEEVKTVSEGQKIADFAKQYAGKAKYTYGGTSPSTGFDCSGFVYYVYNNCGHSISRSCSVQARSGRAVTKANLEAGDLVFF